MDIVSIAVGAAGVGVVYFAYLAATRGLPAALAWVKAKWNAGKAEIAALEQDIDAAHVKVDAATAKLAVLADSLTSAQRDIAQLKAIAIPSAPAAAPAQVAPATVAAAPIAAEPAAAPQPIG
jgi:hypothetical protein